ncbi:energy-coupling factor transporter transmembrane component T family protein [Mycoplasmopsis iners]|uniref:energy-coupling factor transporter transmembrane component T family protein n=1 Tax=Mycoplasmopsis iners TaxID=76630 RepID=UPI0004982A74|nr:energy-coupling factor transporter transmembrane component T [Mycoplasmopsis iners]
MGNVAIGRYLAINSFIHRLDSRLKLIVNIALIVLVFFTDYFITLGIIYLPLALAYVIATRRFMGLIKLIKMPLIIGFFIYFINIYSMKIKENNQLIDILQKHPEYLWLQFGQSNYGLTWMQLARTLNLIFRIYIMILSTTLFVMTTKPILLTKAIEDLLLPLKLFFVPTHIVATIISIALRFIPTLLEEAQRIVKAQASRGIDFKNGKLLEKAKSFTTLIIPLFVTSFAKAEDLANAMETRGYDPYAKRTRYRRLIWHFRDYAVLLFVIGLITFVILSQSTLIGLDFLPHWYKLTQANF